MSTRYARLSLLLFAILMQVLPAQGAGLEDADARLFRAQLAIAEKGNGRAQYYLGEMHEQGLGTSQDIDEAFKWYARAAEQGDPLAKRKLDHRQEIISEIQKGRAAELPESTEAVAVPVTPDRARKTPKHPAPAVTVTQADQAQQEQDRIREAEREKRRAAVRAMILDRIRNPVGEAFE